LLPSDFILRFPAMANPNKFGFAHLAYRKRRFLLPHSSQYGLMVRFARDLSILTSVLCTSSE